MMIRAYTLVETLLAIVIVALIGVSSAAIFEATSYGTSVQRDTRRLMVRGETMRTRLDTAIRNARAVLASSNGYIVLWTSDTNPDGHVNRSELMLIEVPAGSTTMTAYVGQDAANDPMYAANSDFNTVAQSLKSAPNSNFTTKTTWATGASGLTFTRDNTTPTLAKLVSWSMMLTDQKLTQTVTSGVGLGIWAQPR